MDYNESLLASRQRVESNIDLVLQINSIQLRSRQRLCCVRG